MHGDDENEGLITQLKKRVGTVKVISKFMSKKDEQMMLRYHSSYAFRVEHFTIER